MANENTKRILVATEAEIGKNVLINGCDLDAPEKKTKWVDEHLDEKFEIIEVTDYSVKLKDVPFKVPHNWIYEEKFINESSVEETPAINTPLEELIKTEVCETVFCNGYPDALSLPNNIHPYDFCMSDKFDGIDDFEESELATKWNFEVTEEYGLENVRNIRGAMQNKYSELMDFYNKSMQIPVSDETLDDARKWFNHFDIDASIQNYYGKNSLFLITDEGNAFALELSNAEIEYRAELWNEIEDE